MGLSDCDVGACSIDAPLVTTAEIEELLPQIPSWQIVTIDNINRLVRKYNFVNFAKALDFVNRVGELAEKHGHHPAILLEWGEVEVSWWSHEIKGLHSSDFIFAAKTDAIHKSF